MSIEERAREWVNERTKLDGVRSVLAGVRLPVHRWSVFSVLGRLTLILLTFLVSSGVLLLLYYRPDVAEAHRSVAAINGDVPFGSLVRSIHVWSSDLFVGCLIAHVFAALIQRSYRRPRELIWISGALLFIVCIGLALTGHLLPWTESAYLSARVSSELAGRVPVAGHFLRVFLRGGEEITGTSLSRFFGFHVAILPAALTALVAVHIGLVARHGLSVPKSLEGLSVKSLPYYPHLLLRDHARATVAGFVVLCLAAAMPTGLTPKADPFAAAPAGAHPEWYFLWIFGLIRSLPPRLLGVDGDQVAVTLLLALLLSFILLPLLERKGSRVMFWIGWAGLIAFVGATIHGSR